MKLDKEAVKAALDKPNGSELLMNNDAGRAFDAAWELFSEGSSKACAFLCRAASKKCFADKIEYRIIQDDTAIFNAMASGDPKMRKNAARLIGALKNDAFVPMLTGALENESVRFVRPSILLALGAIGGDDAKQTLEAYVIEPPSLDSERKHFEEEKDALKKALSGFKASDKHTFTMLGGMFDMELRCPEKLSASLADELDSLGFTVGKKFNNAVRVKTDDYKALFSARCFFEALFPVSTGITTEPEKLAKNIRPFLCKLLIPSHTGSSTYAYRIEVRGENIDRSALTKALSRLLDDSKDTMDSCKSGISPLHLVNLPSDYEVEIRIEIRGGDLADVYIKLYTFNDERFSYRTGSLPASMNPATAAAVLRMAKEYLTEGARVLDPCCGSGTLLIEREKLKPVASLTGVDIAHKAIDIARKNAEAASSKAKFIVNDCLRFEAKRKYDELIANLPFGNRVGTHKNNTALYKGVLDRLGTWVKSGGTAILYTMEFTLMKHLIKERDDIQLVSEARTDAGGLTPTIFILKIK